MELWSKLRINNLSNESIKKEINDLLCVISQN